MARYIVGFNGLAAALARAAAEERVVAGIAMAGTVHIVHHHVTEQVMGNSNKLPSLAPSTQDDRVSKGHTPNDPLVRDGSLLKSNIEGAVTSPWTGGVGSEQMVQLYSELGFRNHRTGAMVPPRPALREGALESEHDVVGMWEVALGYLFLRRIP